MPRKTITYENTHNGVEINTGVDNSLGCYINILNALYSLLDNYARAHSQVMVVHLCLNFGIGNIDKTNNSIQSFMHTFIARLKYLGFDPGYLWVREHGQGETQHYHLAVLANRNKVQSSWCIQRIAQEHWGNVTKTGTVYLNGSKDLIRNPALGCTDFSGCYYWLSYLAKVRTKDLQPTNLRKFSVSQPKYITMKILR